jgi:hypothetical protein
MPDLERELRALGSAIDFPPTPNLAAAVRLRLRAPRERTFPAWRVLALAVAALALVAGGVLAVPSARTAVLEWLGLRGVSIERVPESRRVPPGGELALGHEVTLAEARELAGFRVHVPRGAGVGEPDAVYFSSAYVSGGYVSFVYGSSEDVRLLVTQFRARIDEGLVQKLIAPGTTVERTSVRGASTGFWIEGAPHEIFYVDGDGAVVPDTARLAENTLLWQLGAVTYRLEGAETLQEAVRIARSMR